MPINALTVGIRSVVNHNHLIFDDGHHPVDKVHLVNDDSDVSKDCANTVDDRIRLSTTIVDYLVDYPSIICEVQAEEAINVAVAHTVDATVDDLFNNNFAISSKYLS
ncbi:hypothetical protein NDU88_003488 [Pleurodeles waltl]|uniref:Uncharacterized protein n=1 Tax=Pleurodeles waltl TaxID=8319 RepID=A0AAV7QFT0_PLEWA|nr:hypothetical protein NDU88_003488 [Pleurodeles waltl]